MISRVRKTNEQTHEQTGKLEKLHRQFRKGRHKTRMCRYNSNHCNKSSLGAVHVVFESLFPTRHKCET